MQPRPKSLAEDRLAGTKMTKYSDGDYYRVFPADTRMVQIPEYRGR